MKLGELNLGKRKPYAVNEGDGKDDPKKYYLKEEKKGVQDEMLAKKEKRVKKMKREQKRRALENAEKKRGETQKTVEEAMNSNGTKGLVLNTQADEDNE
ncbi:hypothetical protein TSAR_011115 [Trichomalopsis sarcophagae]|uniref:Uncharacterized protein n=1 Tax=Trichomalopsis sarcophagae TaxID=543379 RepID=A0A232F1S4_9HYME|nr:hypothetical protein TSAR_011115 [Trichomalopsis sarcophagae]